ncbi:hypothetical protein BKA82DRAFT_20110 [Pisolithus tinctorius]|uniref:Uncharacterized protein n=1 Tax=Pisolithus tinctorius Marx 270 TaxID=870435 RepID=A0A0C3PEN2_PISTI|nr:hypothetical protein BKA82DRAFT_20110 [Pisolithus tinctorius]KIO12285.1 hypothetical protein M404DRAFT_20110 [Pisolithus tinctorius Marx 270]
MPSNIQVNAPVVISSALDGPGGSPYVSIPNIQPTIIPINLIQRDPSFQPLVVRIAVPSSAHDEYLIISLSYFVQFVFKRVEDHVYTLTTNGKQVVDVEGKLFAMAGGPVQEWVIKYRELQNAYTITKRLDTPEEIGWIAPTYGGDPQIRVGPLNDTPTAPPGQYPLEQLYRFQLPS